jgi:peptidoglycan/LPS O-acetylase OafA/YrhL
MAVLSLFVLVTGNRYIEISGNENIQAGIPALILIIGLLFLEPYINGDNRVIKFGILLGDASYVMYLFHPYCIYFFQRLVFPKIIQTNIIIEIMKVLISIFATMIFSIYCYKLVDKPIQNGLKSIFINK